MVTNDAAPAPHIVDMLGTTNVFIFYSRKDEEWAQNIEKALKLYNVDVWRDAVDMVAGDNIDDILYQKICKSDYVVLIISQHSLNSEWVQKEINTVLKIEQKENRKILVPFIVSNVELPSSPENRACINATGVFRPEDVDEIVRTIARRNENRFSKFSPYASISNSNEGLFIGVDVGTTKIACGLVEIKQNSFLLLMIRLQTTHQLVPRMKFP